MTKELRAIILCAVSTPEQAKKDSLDTQERDCRDYCKLRDWFVTEVLTVPGQSRNYDNIQDIMAAVPAYRRLWELIDARAFDVLVLRSFDRLARDIALMPFLIQRTIRAGAIIYLLQGGEVNESNYVLAASMASFQAVQPVRTFVEQARESKKERARQGLMGTGSPPLSHKYVRDPVTGKRIKMIVDESRRPLFDAMAELILSHFSWRGFEEELYRRYGIVNPKTGKRYGQMTLWRLVNNPVFWGHTGVRYSAEVWNKTGKRVTGAWIFDPDELPPEGMTLFYNTHEAVYTDELGEKIKAELRRRYELVKGASAIHRIFAFSGLLICASCQQSLHRHQDQPNKKRGQGRWTAWSCMSKYYSRSGCENRKYVPDKAIRAALDERLRELVKTRDLTMLSPVQEANQFKQLEKLRRDIGKLDYRISTWIDERTEADETIRHIFTDKISQATRDRKSLHAKLSQLQSEIESDSQHQDRQTALNELVEMTIDKLWELDPREINRILHRLFGMNRLVADQGVIVGIARGLRARDITYRLRLSRNSGFEILDLSERGDEPPKK